LDLFKAKSDKEFHYLKKGRYQSCTRFLIKMATARRDSLLSDAMKSTDTVTAHQISMWVAEAKGLDFVIKLYEEAIKE